MTDSAVKAWKVVSWGDGCPRCGAAAEILTDAPGDLGCDGDTARCTVCRKPGWVAVYDEEHAIVNWEEAYD